METSRESTCQIYSFTISSIRWQAPISISMKWSWGIIIFTGGQCIAQAYSQIWRICDSIRRQGAWSTDWKCGYDMAATYMNMRSGNIRQSLWICLFHLWARHYVLCHEEYVKGSLVVVMALEGILNLSAINWIFKVNWKLSAYTMRYIKLTGIGKDVIGIWCGGIPNW